MQAHAASHGGVFCRRCQAHWAWPPIPSLLQYAQEDAETVYFNDSCDAARQAVQDLLDSYQQLLGKLRCAGDGRDGPHTAHCHAAALLLRSHTNHLPARPPPPQPCCSNDERGKLQRSMGLKMEQIKAEVCSACCSTGRPLTRELLLLLRAAR